MKSSNITVVKWCTFCSKTQATGILTVEDAETKEHIPLPACNRCGERLKNA